MLKVHVSVTLMYINSQNTAVIVLAIIAKVTKAIIANTRRAAF